MAVKEVIYLRDCVIRCTTDGLFDTTEMGPCDGEKARQAVSAYLTRAKRTNEKWSILVDLNRAGKPTVGARHQFIELTRSDAIEKIAFHGLHPLARIIASFLIDIADQQKMAFFSRREDALKWLGRGVCAREEENEVVSTKLCEQGAA
jgi:hypothetical protein